MHCTGVTRVMLLLYVRVINVHDTLCQVSSLEDPVKWTDGGTVFEGDRSVEKDATVVGRIGCFL